MTIPIQTVSRNLSAGDGGKGAEREEYREISDVLARYTQFFPNECQRLRQLQAQLLAGDDVLNRSNMTGHVTTSATVLNSAGTKALFIFHNFFQLWIPPGGHYEPPGSLWSSAIREVEEETGVVGVAPHPWTFKNMLPVDIDTHAIAANPAKHEGGHLHHDFRFLAVASELAPLVPQLKEVLEARWISLADFRNSPNFRVRALHQKLLGMGLLPG